jgi:hypothetical protein
MFLYNRVARLKAGEEEDSDSSDTGNGDDYHVYTFKLSIHSYRTS